MNEPSMRRPLLLFRGLSAISVLTLVSVGSFAAGYRYGQHRSHTGGRTSVVKFRSSDLGTPLPVGFYYGTLGDLRFAVSAHRDGSLAVDAYFHGGGLRGFTLQYHPRGRFGVPSVSFFTNLVTGGRESTRKVRSFLVTDVGIWGRPSLESRVTAGGKMEQLWWLRGKWVHAAKVTPPILTDAGVRYRYDAATGGWRRTAAR